MTQTGKLIGPSIKISLMTYLDHGAFKWDTLTEWSKLLLILERHVEEDWLIPRAEELFEDAIEMGWDEKNEGLYYGFAPNGDVC